MGVDCTLDLNKIGDLGCGARTSASRAISAVDEFFVLTGQCTECLDVLSRWTSSTFV